MANLNMSDLIIECWRNVDTGLIEISYVQVIADTHTNGGDVCGGVNLYTLGTALDRIIREFGYMTEWDELNTARIRLTFESPIEEFGMSGGYMPSDPEWIAFDPEATTPRPDEVN